MNSDVWQSACKTNVHQKKDLNSLSKAQKTSDTDEEDN